MEYLAIKNQTYQLNDAYFLFPDKDRALLLTDGGNSYSLNLIHPIHALMLTFFDGAKKLHHVIQDLQAFFSLEVRK